MSDRSWMLKTQAIRTAKTCIQIVRKETGVKLTLSDEAFIQNLHGFVEELASPDLSQAYSELLAMAGVGNVMRSLQPKDATSSAPPQSKVAGSDITGIDPTETVDVGGHTYPKWRDGKAFSGLYRGQPIYH